ncbi:MAG: 3-hydroxyacyl-CoA dehydrogenase NAD-binding domain-containing protein [Rhodospirillales bacterium]|jgi:3-hydroxyacyl-CoA dehydrogenase|nr:3-hydroxyacyl-CoA dehydrogenase NAD-binding domain-containing protein [Rhodospirillales bacterium]
MNMPSPNDIRRIAVIGTGVIGSGWVTYFLARGFEVQVTDPAPGAKDRLAAFIEQAWPAVGELGMAADADADGWTFLPDVEAATEGADFVQENAPDDLDEKRRVFAQIDAVAPPEVAIASSSSALLMTPIQKGLRHPGRCFLGHPFNPPHMIPLVEVSGGEQTDDAVLDWAVEFYAAIGKQPARLNREISGHIAGRLGAAVWREAVSLVDQGIADAAAVDAAMTYGPGLRFALAGPTMIFHMGGGPGGLRHYLEHLGASQERRWASMVVPKLTPELCEKLVAGAEAQAGGRSVAELEGERDACLAAVLKAITQVRGA